jgi:sirohydrochlorin ferrochelatase
MSGWQDDALLLIGHGAAAFADAGRILHGHADALRTRADFAAVGVGLLNGAPSVADTLAVIAARRVHVVPFFMEDGWFVRVAVPAALGDGKGHELILHPPVGVHPELADLACARVLHACGPRSSQYSVLLLGHGSARAPGRRMAVHRHGERMAKTGQFAQVAAAFLEEPPFIADALRHWRATPVAVLGFFAGEGGHVRHDVPRLLAAERAQRGDVPLLDLGVIADDPAMPRLILDQVAAASDT